MGLMLLILTGCTEQTLAVFNTAPAAQITSPANGDAFDAGDLIEFAGKIADAQGVQQVLVQWESDLDGVIGDGQPDSGGLVYLAYADLSPGDHVITLYAEDPELLSSSDAIALTIRGDALDQDQDGYDITVDCDDLDAAVYPGADEVAWDDIDQDCDGEDLHDYVALYAGGYFTCAVSTLDVLHCWGSDYFGQVSNAPEDPPLQMETGGNHACALLGDGDVMCWGVEDGGSADYGQVTQTPTTQLAQVSAGGAHSCGITDDEGIACWGWDESAQVSNIPDGSFTTVSAGSFHSCAVTTGKGIRCWGAQDGGPYDAGQSDAPTTINFADVGAGYLHSCALTVTGGVQCWGLEDPAHPAEGGQVTDTPNDDAYASLSVGLNHNCALARSNGLLSCWGDNAEGQVSGTPEEEGFIAVAAGGEHTCALDSIGRAICWGDDSAGQATPP